MKKQTIFLCAGLISTLLISPVFASNNDDDDKQKNYQEHYKQRHQMNMEMMQMLSETMTILRDINHKPSDTEKARLGDMIKQLEQMIAEHKMMTDKTMQRMDMHMKNDGRGKHYDKNW